MPKKLLLIIIIMATSLSFAIAQEFEERYEVGTFHVIKSKVLDQDRRLLIHLPDGYKGSSKAYPVFYMTYADHRETYFLEVVSALAGLSGDGYIPEMIIVGVDNLDRYGDHLPLLRSGEPARADKFLSFFNDELFPYVEETFRTKPFRLFFGPQAAAGFALYASLVSPDSFNACIVNNPFWVSYNRDYLLKLAKDKFTAGIAKNQFIYFTYKDSYWGDPGEVEYIHKFKELCQTSPSERYSAHFNYLADYKYFGDPSGLEDGLRKYFVDYKLFERPEIKSLEEIEVHYSSLSEQYGYEVEIPELTLVFSSDATMNAGFMEEAKEILIFTQKIYPASVNAMMRLGNIHEHNGELEKALQQYKQAAGLLSDNAFARNKITELEEKLK